MTEEHIIAKVRKLLNLANGKGATEGERDNALRMAYGLLAKHNLSMERVEESSQERSQVKGDFYSRPWARQVANSIAQLFFCTYFVERGRDLVTHCFVGEQANSITAKEMSAYLVSSILREARRSTDTVAQRNSFCSGAAVKIAARVGDLLKAPPAEMITSSSMALALVDRHTQEQHKNDEWLVSKGVKLSVKPYRGKVDHDWSAYAKGSEYGGKVSLNKQVSKSKEIK